jgi:hypothetical protein
MVHDVAETGIPDGEGVRDKEARDAAVDQTPPDSSAAVPDADAAAPAEVDNEPPFPLGEPLPDTPIGEWERISIEGAVCQDGSQAGFSLRRSGASEDVLIYQQVGGACFNRSMCGASRWGGAPFQNPSGRGIFDFDNPENPVADLNMIFIPYCTGDIHAGSRPNATVEGVRGEHQFVGGDNFRLYLKRIVPTFPQARKVVFAGWSAGGFGALFNYMDLRRAFGKDVAAVIISDGGPPMSDEYIKPCLAKQLRETFDLDEYIPEECTECYNEDGGGLSNLVEFIFTKYPDTIFGLDSAYHDMVIRMFFSYGLNDCQGTLGAQYPAALYKEGLLELRDRFSGLDSIGDAFGTYYFSGQDHGRIDRPAFYRQSVDGIRFVDWFASVVAGNPFHVAE